MVPKRLLQTTLRRVITKKSEQFSSTVAEAYDHGFVLFMARGEA
jgi:hypothetical protein